MSPQHEQVVLTAAYVALGVAAGTILARAILARRTCA